MLKKVYKFSGDYEKLKELGFLKYPFLIDGLPMFTKLGINYSICIYDYVSVKIYNESVGMTYTSPEIVKDYIQDLISNKLVKIKKIKEEV